MPRPAVGPRLQCHVPDRDWEVIETLMSEHGLKQSEAIRHVIRLGTKEVRKRRGTK